METTGIRLSFRSTREQGLQNVAHQGHQSHSTEHTHGLFLSKSYTLFPDITFISNIPFGLG